MNWFEKVKIGAPLEQPRPLYRPEPVRESLYAPEHHEAPEPAPLSDSEALSRCERCGR